jgi:hypothetical protein
VLRLSRTWVDDGRQMRALAFLVLFNHFMARQSDNIFRVPLSSHLPNLFLAQCEDLTMALRTTRSTVTPIKPRQFRPKVKIRFMVSGLVAFFSVFYCIVHRALRGDSDNLRNASSKSQLHHAKSVTRAKIERGEHNNKVSKHRKKNIAVAESHHRPDQTLRENTQILEVEEDIKETFETTNVRACKWFEKGQQGELIETFDDACKGRSNLVAYNPLKQVRYLCGKEVPEEGYLLLKDPCGEGSRVFPKDAELHPPLDSEPVVGANVGFKPSALLRVECDVPCHKRARHFLPVEIETSNWRFTFSMEGSAYNNGLAVDKTAWSRNSFYATTSFQSDVPLPYFSWAEYSIQKPGVKFSEVIKGASFIARNCKSRNNRESVVRNLTQMMRVDSLSQCLHTAEPPSNLSMTDKMAVQKEYLFHLAFENTCEDDYITEKLWGTFASGTVPVYYGAPNVKDHVPPNSIISWHDFNDTTKLGNHLIKVAGDQQLYESYHAWRYQPLPEVFINKFNFTHTHSMCRLCRWSYARTYGFGWNHTFQTVQHTRVPRTLCKDAKGLVTHPFRERWLSGGSTIMEAVSDDDCGESHPSIQIGTSSRTAWSHDGVLDIVVNEGPGADVELELHIPLNATLQEKAPGHYVFQDAQSRYTILTRQRVRAYSGESGVMRLSDFQAGFILRLIIEDLDNFHYNATEQINDFAQRMTIDFLNPVEFYLLEGATLPS